VPRASRNTARTIIEILTHSMLLAAANQSFWQEHGDEISAAITLVVAILIAIIVDRVLIGRAVKATTRMDTAQLSREARTRLRLIRRLLFLAIILIGVALALSQFTSIKRFATGVLASTAVLGIIIGFAGRQVIANLVSGVLLAITQPIRIGDLVSIGDEVHGRVTDIALTYTSVDAGDGSLIVVPNEKVATDVVVNHSSGNPAAPVTVDVWLPPDADIEAARAELEKGEVTSARLIEVTPDGARLQVKAALDAGVDREAHEAELRERAQSALRSRGLLSST
jgi:small conductance mechanosensitive channel